MPTDTDEVWGDRRRANEDEYFRKRDRELVEKVRLRAQDEAALQRLAEAAGVTDDDILQGLQRLGYTAETVKLLQVVPLIDVAWADGHVSEPERQAILAVTRALGIEAGSHADHQLARWLLDPPSNVLSDGTLRLLRAIVQRRPPDERAAATRRLLSACSAVAASRGGMFGFRAISDKEQRALDRILSEMERSDASSTDA
jgi:hypothetical protein